MPLLARRVQVRPQHPVDHVGRRRPRHLRGRRRVAGAGDGERAQRARLGEELEPPPLRAHRALVVVVAGAIHAWCSSASRVTILVRCPAARRASSGMAPPVLVLNVPFQATWEKAGRPAGETGRPNPGARTSGRERLTATGERCAMVTRTPATGQKTRPREPTGSRHCRRSRNRHVIEPNRLRTTRTWRWIGPMPPTGTPVGRRHGSSARKKTGRRPEPRRRVRFLRSTWAAPLRLCG